MYRLADITAWRGGLIAPITKEMTLPEAYKEMKQGPAGMVVLYRIDREQAIRARCYGPMIKL